MQSQHQVITLWILLTLFDDITKELKQKKLSDKFCNQIGHVKEYSTMQYFGNPRHTQSMMAYMILTEFFLEIPVKNCIVGMLLTCPIANKTPST